MTGDSTARVLDVAARVFAADGYRDASLHAIRDVAEVSADEFSAEFPEKYPLFAAVVLRAAAAALNASDHVGRDAANSRQARGQLIAVIEATARATMAQREATGFYRAEVRHLRTPQIEHYRALTDELHERIRRPLATMRPDLTPDDIRVFAFAATSAIASITIHPTTLPEPKMLALLTSAAMRVLDSRPVTAADIIERPPVHIPWHHDDSPRSRMLRHGFDLFAEHGCRAVSLQQIADAADVSVADIEREFGSRLGVIRTGCLVGYTLIKRSNEAALELPGGPRGILAGLCGSFVHHSFGDPSAMTVFLNDARHLEGEGAAEMLEFQSHTVDHWLRTLLEARPELSMPEARFLVFAGLNMVNDIGRATGWNRADPLAETRVERLVLAALAMATVRR